jgi:hypothetical protein
MPERRLLLRGMRGPDVARLQRLLARAGFHTRADGMFGPATAAALGEFQRAAGLEPEGIAGPLTMAALTSAAARAIADAPVPPPGSPFVGVPPSAAGGLAEATMAVALAELAAGSREQGGENRGEWVRKYMGVEGLPWCVGFATWCYRRACERRKVEPVLSERWSSSRLVKEARAMGLVVDPARCAPDAGGEPARTGGDVPRQDCNSPASSSIGRVQPGHFFVLRGGPTGFSHTGIVRTLGWSASRRLEYITTVEGNTRLAGESAPDRVVTRFRGVSALVFAAF